MRVIACAGLLLAACAVSACAQTTLEWSDAPALPPAPGEAAQPGLAGAFVGVSGNALLVAGGANFPDAPPWEGGAKAWWDQVYVLTSLEGGVSWRVSETGLPRPIGYGVSVTLPEGVLCIGGCDGEECCAETFLLKCDELSGAVSTEPYPPLPRPLAFAAGALVGDAVYVAGGQESAKGPATTDFFRLDLTKRGSGEFGWEELPAWPGPPRVVACAAGQSGAFYLFSGRDAAPDRETRLLTDAYQYDPTAKAWTRKADITPDGDAPRCVMGAPTIASGARHILVFGGDDGRELLAREESEGEELTRLFEEHAGFGRDVLAYHTVTDTWTRIGETPGGSQVTTTATSFGGRTVIPSGETHPGVRTAAVRTVVVTERRSFGAVNYTVLIVYLGCLVLMGAYFSKREKGVEDFFKASGRIPWWAAGLSIFGTQLSAITFMAIPAKTFAADWRNLTGNLTIFLVAPFIIMLFLPFYRRLNVTTAYEYLERRFNPAARLLGSLMFILLHLGRLGIVLFLPSIALSVVTGMDVGLCILLMGVLTIVYTAMGGIEAVIWTDVVQVFVLLGGALYCLIAIVCGDGEGLGAMVSAAADAGKLHTFDLSFNLTQPTFWTMLLGATAANLVSYGSDQTVIQRYLTTKDERSAARSIWTNAILCIPASLLFFAMGTALWLFYRSHPAALDPTLANPDAIFPSYIVTRLPAGLAGLLVAGIFAAAMSSLDSSMNSISAALTTDFYRRFRPKVSERRALVFARWVTVIVGVLGTGFALVMARWETQSLWDQFMKLVGLFAGGLAGLFLLGIFTKRVSGAAGVAGLLTSAATQYLLGRLTPLHDWFFSFTGLATCMVVGYVVSLAFPRRESVEGLTIHTVHRTA